jgi:hypothetical protein
MPDFHYQIKGRTDHSLEGGPGWAWPPVFSGIVTAPDRKAAKLAIEDEYGRTFPLRVLRVDIEQHAYLLHIREVDKEDDYIRRRFQVAACKVCSTSFRPIDKYNDPHCDHAGPDYCSAKCAKIGKVREAGEFVVQGDGRLPAVIYQIRQRSSGKIYVGQTIRAFTLRWWQHLVNSSDCKFHATLKSTPVTDWEFSVLEVIDGDVPCKAAYLTERERFWIEKLDTVTSGFNTILPTAAA